jgi:putative ABC transport system substrate-binding protein
MNRNVVILSIILIFLTISVCQGTARAAQKIVAVQSIGIQPYEESLNGFKNAFGNDIHRLILSEMKRGTIASRINELKPALILAIGIDALNQVSKITNVPIIYLMVLSPPASLSTKTNLYGVRMALAPELQLRKLFNALPNAKAIGLLYNPDRAGELTDRAIEIARKNGTKIVAKGTRNPQNVPRLLQELRGQIDVLLMLPDLTVITPETVEAMLLFSLENKVPLVSFSEKYVEMGALMSIGVDAFDMGMQAGEMAQRILSGGTVNVHHTDARKAVISINSKVAKTLGISINQRTIGKVELIN